MSKVDELRKKYPNITNPVFNKFANGDKTKTKKYLPFMLSTWANRTSQIGSSSHLVELVNMFDELLPYIQNKDIYSEQYKNINIFLKTLDDAMELKDEKTFEREEHIDVLMETDDFILLSPKTHRGSCKYGSNTKWCTASKNDPETFINYTKNGYLAYLISKKDMGLNNSKIAFYCNKDLMQDKIHIYNSIDKEVSVENVLDGGWKPDVIFHITSLYRAHGFNYRKIIFAKSKISDVVKRLESVDFNMLKQCLKVVDEFKENDYINEVKEKINKFVENIKIKL
jgi:hypothetical protein